MNSFEAVQELIYPFIASERQSLLDELVRRVKGKERDDAWLHGFNVDMTNGYNRALDDIIKIIKGMR